LSGIDPPLSPSPQPSAPPPSRRRDHRRLLIRFVMVVVGLAAIFLLLQHTGWPVILRSFGQVGLAAFALVTILGFSEHLIDTLALHTAMLGRVSLRGTLLSNSTGALVNTFIPLEAGEVVKGALLRQRSTHGQVLAGLVVWNYVWKVAKPCALVVLFFGAELLGNVYPRDLRWTLLGGVAVSFLPYLLLRMLIRARPAERLARLLARVPRLRPHLGGWVEGAIVLDRAVRQFWREHPRAYVRVFLLIFAGRLLGVASLAVLAARLGLPADAGSVAFLYVATMVIEYVTMLLPARLGVTEGSSFLLFKVMGLDPAAGLVMAVILRIRAVVMLGPTGLLGWVRLHDRGGRKPLR
jgi:hypothetical protein